MLLQCRAHAPGRTRQAHQGASRSLSRPQHVRVRSSDNYPDAWGARSTPLASLASRILHRWTGPECLAQRLVLAAAAIAAVVAGPARARAMLLTPFVARPLPAASRYAQGAEHAHIDCTRLDPPLSHADLHSLSGLFRPSDANEPRVAEAGSPIPLIPSPAPRRPSHLPLPAPPAAWHSRTQARATAADRSRPRARSLPTRDTNSTSPPRP